MTTITVYKTKWYLVRSDRSGVPWRFYVLTKPFKSQQEAGQFARTHGLANGSHAAWRERDVPARIADQQSQDIEVIWEKSTGTYVPSNPVPMSRFAGCEYVMTLSSPLGMKRKTFWLEQVDESAVQTISGRYGCKSETQAVRLALRVLANSPMLEVM